MEGGPAAGGGGGGGGMGGPRVFLRETPSLMPARTPDKSGAPDGPDG